MLTTADIHNFFSDDEYEHPRFDVQILNSSHGFSIRARHRGGEWDFWAHDGVNRTYFMNRQDASECITRIILDRPPLAHCVGRWRTFTGQGCNPYTVNCNYSCKLHCDGSFSRAFGEADPREA